MSKATIVDTSELTRMQKSKICDIIVEVIDLFRKKHMMNSKEIAFALDELVGTFNVTEVINSFTKEELEIMRSDDFWKKFKERHEKKGDLDTEVMISLREAIQLCKK